MKYHVGCGKRNFGTGWVHVDGASFPHIQSNDIFLKEVPENSADIIYASHLIEYFDRQEVKPLLEYWHRALKPGGILRIAVPDFESVWDQYEVIQNLDELLGLLYGKMELNGSDIYHKTVYDFESLSNLLKNIGFNSVRKYDWRKTEHADIDDHSQAYLPHMDKKHGKLMSLNIQAIK